VSVAGPIDPVDGIEPGRRLIRVDGDKGQSLAERLAHRLHMFAWRTPLHSMRLRGRYPLKLLGVPRDPLPGDARAGQAILDGRIEYRGESVELETLDFANPGVSPAFADYLQTFAWLRDLAAAAPRERGAPLAELVVRLWLGTHGGSVREAAHPILGVLCAADPVFERHRLSLLGSERARARGAASRPRGRQGGGRPAARGGMVGRDRGGSPDPRR
jgi:hypothetical protein